MLFDTHCHIQFKAYADDRDEVIKKCQEKGVILNVVGTQQKMSKKAVELAEKYDHIYASVGLHPIQEHEVDVVEEDTCFTSIAEMFDDAFYDALAQHPKVIAIGETGMDRFHIPKDCDAELIMKKQKETFLKHYALAQKYDLPLVIHVRDAHEDMIKVLDDIVNGRALRRDPTAPAGHLPLAGEEQSIRGTVHCFSGNREQAEQYVSFGLHLGFTGIITYPPRKTDPEATTQILDAIAHMPLERIIVETDSPFLAPQEYRGKRAEPWMVDEVVKKIAEVRGMTYEEAAKVTTENALRLFSKIKV